VNPHLILGLFALYVAVASLVQVLAGKQDTLLAKVRQTWGRTLGLGLYFLVHVTLPVLVCVLCLGWGVSRFGEPPESTFMQDAQLLLRDWEIPVAPDLFTPKTYPEPSHLPAIMLAA